MTQPAQTAQILGQRPRPVYIAALYREVAAVIGSPALRWHADQHSAARNIHVYSNDRAVIACAGMGAVRASLAVEAAMALGPVAQLVSVGWAGACIHRLHVGDVFVPDLVIDSKTGERYFPQKQRDRHEGLELLVTVPAPAGVREKERLAVGYYASAVDMEAAAVARIARCHNLPFAAIKAISDEANFELPDLDSFSTPTGQFREVAFGLHVAIRPHLWNSVRTLARGSKLAAQRLRTEIEAHILAT